MLAMCAQWAWLSITSSHSSHFSLFNYEPIEVCYWIDMLAMCAQWMSVTLVYLYIQCVPNGCYMCTSISKLRMIM
jgi:hypothetical protein